MHDAAADDTPVHVLPFPATVHATALVTAHVILVVCPDGTRRGEAEMEPDAAGIRH